MTESKMFEYKFHEEEEEWEAYLETFDVSGYGKTKAEAVKSLIINFSQIVEVCAQYLKEEYRKQSADV